MVPVVLSMEEVAHTVGGGQAGSRESDAVRDWPYGCGLRISELLGLQVTDIDASRMVVTVRHGKKGEGSSGAVVGGCCRRTCRIGWCTREAPLTADRSRC